jgi:hypothetical protein
MSRLLRVSSPLALLALLLAGCQTPSETRRDVKGCADYLCPANDSIVRWIR